MDFDSSVRGEGLHNGCIQAEVYRAPEVILDAGYSYSADIWSLWLWCVLSFPPLSFFNPVEGVSDVRA